MAIDKEDFIGFAAAGGAVLLVGFLGFRHVHPSRPAEAGGGYGAVATTTTHDIVVAKREDCAKPTDFCLVLPKVPLSEAERVFSADRHRAWIFGGSGFLARLDDNALTIEARPTAASLLAMASTDSDDAWAVGTGGALLHFDGTAWSAKDTEITDDISGVATAAKDEIWLVTRGSQVYRGNGTKFDVATNGIESRDLIAGVRAILAPKRGVAWLVPQTGAPYRWSGKSWTRMPIEKAPETFTVAAAAIDASGELWLFPWQLGEGYARSSGGKITYESFSSLKSFTSGVVANANGRGASVCVTTADGQVYDVRPHVATLRTRVPGIAEGAAVAASDCVFDTAIALEHGAVARLDGRTWHDSRSAADAPPVDAGSTGGSADESGELFYGVAGASPKDVWIASSKRTYHWDGQALSEPRGIPAFASFLSADGDLRFGRSADARLFRHEGSAFALVDSTAAFGNGQTGSPIAADGRDAFVLATDGSPQELVRFQNGTAEKLPKLNDRVTVAYVVAPNDVWAAGEALWHGDGKSWKRSEAPPIDGYGKYASFHGTGPNDVWATGDLGQVRHWDGTSWKLIVTPNYYDVLNKVWTDRPGHAWFVGITGAIFEWDGTKMLRVPSGTRRALYDVWSKDGATWITGEDVLLRRGG